MRLISYSKLQKQGEGIEATPDRVITMNECLTKLSKKFNNYNLFRLIEIRTLGIEADKGGECLERYY